MTSILVHRNNLPQPPCVTREADAAVGMVPVALHDRVPVAGARAACADLAPSGVSGDPDLCGRGGAHAPSSLSPSTLQPFDVFALEEQLRLPPSVMHPEAIDAILDNLFTEVMCGAGAPGFDVDIEHDGIDSEES